MAAYIDTQTQKADLAYVREVMREPLLAREEEMRLAQSWRQDRDEKALHILIKSYTRLVISAAIRFRHYGLPIGDLIQEGNLGLMYAAERFEPDRDIRFSTYAKWWIRSTIQDYILRNWSIVRTGSTSAQKQLFFNLRRLRAQLTDVTTENMSNEDRTKVADELHVAVKEVENMEHRLSAHDFSLSNVMNDEGNESWVDTLVDERPTPEVTVVNAYDANVRHLLLEDAMKILSIRERHIVMERRLNDTPITLEELGKNLNISKERVRQLEVKALRKMRMQLIHHIRDIKELF